MSSRVAKPKSGRSSTERRSALLSSLLLSTVEMAACSACESRGIPKCAVSPQDSSRCVECLRSNRSGCDVLGISPAQLRKIGQQHAKLEEELEAAEEARRRADEKVRLADAKVERLRKQKKMWFEKMMRAVSRGIDDLEELDRVEREEAEQEERRRSAEVLPEVSLESLLPDSNFVWDSTFPMGPLNPSLLDEMNVLAQHSVGSSGGMVSSPGRPLTSGNDPTPDSIGGAVPGNSRGG
ncbi:hypothetical protein, variant 1 [Pyricularia oryzae 70-15]|uniref:Uncharacterized protein n=2 Tax=Pyricularia oryzae (strain 70-15 / ATCC MYA-4617 / FGSC 8958) TaxID=242507 RepID=G4NIK4_PYRO7|nr:hypothetical protein, variant 1 [Pyricularia oryzae 70-15]EHA48065.1 hypothetical protein, variant 1 [Pyricularia oryzae 70-15]